MVLTLAVATVHGGPPQKPQLPAFKVQVDLVAVDVRAADARGRPVNDLGKDDFELLDDGKPQAISTFERVDIPVAGPTRQGRIESLPEVRTNADGVTGRVYLLVLDDVNTNFDRSGYVQRTAREFIEKYIEPGDVAAVAFISGRRNVSQDFTSDRRRLLTAVEKFSGLIPPPGAVTGPGGAAPVASGRGAFQTLRVLAEFLGTVKGRPKACVYIGEGFNPPGRFGDSQARPGGVYAASEQSQPDRFDYEELAAAANRANVSIYTVDPRGLSALAEGANANQFENVSGADVQDKVISQQDGMAWLAVLDRRNQRREHEQLHGAVHANPARPELVLPARLLSVGKPEGGLVAQDHRPGETARHHRARPRRGLRPESVCAVRGDRHHGQECPGRAASGTRQPGASHGNPAGDDGRAVQGRRRRRAVGRAW